MNEITKKTVLRLIGQECYDQMKEWRPERSNHSRSQWMRLCVEDAIKREKEFLDILSFVTDPQPPRLSGTIRRDTEPATLVLQKPETNN